ncbi:TPA: hypothetical protein ACXF8G_000245 [Escherichia coli]|uniref:hypothetical protein n=1 Tax=Enterobacteriaceae TaxID=543 RepID=UPI0016499D88|nr:MULTISPECIES: hypothetical protein [Enterobacteriaceae]EJE8109854.1 hypothetical protein [Escherichia coli]EKY5124844.1 hypothetical protein [Escherichia coli]EME5203943.1 hypothetical protein [Escherichia coli]MBI1500639.1 hypothetical protein [Escherichia coli]MCE1997708.1 hypothetical protein [Escherichia coli]|eukprot:gene10373-12087_t
MECKVNELVKRGHDQAAELKSSCGAVDVRDVAQFISDLATQLDVQLARSNTLASENAGLKESRKNLAEFIHEELDAGYPLNMDIETPATDAFLAEVRAQGVEMLIKHCEQKALEKSYDFFMDAGAVAAQFAYQLRKGVQS